MNPDEDLTSMAGAPEAQGADAASPVDDLSLDAAPTGDEEPTGDTPPEEGDEETKDDEDNELNKKMTIDDVIAGMKRLLEVSQKKFEKLCADHNLDPVDYDDNPEADDMVSSAGTPPPADPNAAAGGDMPPADPNAAAGGMPPAPPPDLGGGLGGDMGAGAPPAQAPVQESEDEYECDDCQFTTTSLTEMIEHLKNEHGMTSQEIDDQIKGFMGGVEDEEDDMETPVHSEGDVLDISTDDEDTALTPMREPEDTMTSLTAIRTSVPVQTSDASTLKDRLIARLNDGTNRKVKPSALNVTTQTTAFDAFQAYTPVMRGDGGAWKKMDEFKNSFTPPEEGFEGLPEVYCIKLGDTTLCEDEYENPFFTKNIFEDSTCMFESLDDVGRMMAFLLKDNPNRKYAIHKCKIIDNTHFLLKKNCEEINESWWDGIKNVGSNLWQTAKNVGSGLYDAGANLVSGLKDTVTGGTVQPVNQQQQPAQKPEQQPAQQPEQQQAKPLPTTTADGTAPTNAGPSQPPATAPTAIPKPTLPTTTAAGSAPTNAGPSAPPTGVTATQSAKPLPTTTATGTATTNAGPSAPPTGTTATQSAKPLPTTASAGSAPTNAGPSAPPAGGAAPQGAKPLPTTTATGSAPTNAGPSAPQASGAAAQTAKPLPTTTATGNAPTNAGPSAPPTGGAAPQGSTTIQPSGDTGGSTELPQVQTNAPAGQSQAASGIEPQVKEQIKKVSQELSQLAAQLKE